jgi:hypothetical protein
MKPLDVVGALMSSQWLTMKCVDVIELRPDKQNCDHTSSSPHGQQYGQGLRTNLIEKYTDLTE